MNEPRILRLVRRNIPSIPDIGDVIKPTVPIGKEFYLLSFRPNCIFYNEDIKRRIEIDCYEVKHISGTEQEGLLPVEVFAD